MSNNQYWGQPPEQDPRYDPQYWDQPTQEYGPPSAQPPPHGYQHDPSMQGQPPFDDGPKRRPPRGEGGKGMATKTGDAIAGFIFKNIPIVLTGVVMLVIGAILLSLRMEANNRTSVIADFLGIQDQVGPIIGWIILIPSLFFLLSPALAMLLKFKILYIPGYILGLFLGVYVNNWLLDADIISPLTPFLQHIESLPALLRGE